jgi:hypothetical protein
MKTTPIQGTRWMLLTLTRDEGPEGERNFYVTE